MAFFEGPNGELDWTFVVWDEKFEKYSNNELRSMDAILYGRVAYQKTAYQKCGRIRSRDSKYNGIRKQHE
jgi:hypothetical protein